MHVVPIEPHALIARPASLVGVRAHSLVIRVRIRRQVTLDEFPRFLCRELEQHVNPVDVTSVEADRVTGLGSLVLELQEAVRQLRRAGNLGSTLETQNEEVQDETVVLEDETLAG